MEQPHRPLLTTLLAISLTLLVGFRTAAAQADAPIPVEVQLTSPADVPVPAVPSEPASSGASLPAGLSASTPAAAGPAPAAVASSIAAVPIPEGRFLPYVSPCTFPSPQLKVGQPIGIVGDQIGWYALGFQSGTTVTLRLYTVLNEELVEQRSIEANAWCSIMGTFPIRIPDAYFLSLTGMTPTGESVTVVDSVRGVMDLRPPVAAAPVASPPAAPSSLRATPVNGTMVRLDWTDNARNETGFTIDVENSMTGPFQTGVGANATSVTIGTLQPATRHCFSVSAVSTAGLSARTSACAVTPGDTERVVVVSGR